jgi:hypothetical protein
MVFFIREHQPTAPDLFTTRKETPVSTNATSTLRRHWKPALATGAGGASIVIWFEEIILFLLDILAALGLVLAAIPILLFDLFMFKRAIPKPEDKNQ